MRILVAVAPVDFRRGIDGLAAIGRQQLQQDPMNGWAFVFRNRSATAVKILVYDGQGFWLCQKKLNAGNTQILRFTELKQIGDNQPVGVVETGGLVCIPRKSGPRSDAVKSRNNPIGAVEIGHRTASLCHLGNIAMLLKRKLQWNPRAERFVNDAEANQMLNRPMRTPWQL